MWNTDTAMDKSSHVFIQTSIDAAMRYTYTHVYTCVHVPDIYTRVWSICHALCCIIWQSSIHGIIDLGVGGVCMCVCVCVREQ